MTMSIKVEDKELRQRHQQPAPAVKLLRCGTDRRPEVPLTLSRTCARVSDVRGAGTPAGGTGLER